LAALALVACSPGTDLYVPQDNAMAIVSSRPAALYEVPAESPRGEVRLAALGVTAMDLAGDGTVDVRTLHVHIVVDNDDVGSWQLDTRRQIATLAGYGERRPLYASSDAGRPPLLTVPAGARASVDLYYPLPEKLGVAVEVSHFEIGWRVQTVERSVAEHTSFERIRVEAAPSSIASDGWLEEESDRVATGGPFEP
jgi:hypothetical protein